MPFLLQARTPEAVRMALQVLGIQLGLLAPSGKTLFLEAPLASMPTGFVGALRSVRSLSKLSSSSASELWTPSALKVGSSSAPFLNVLRRVRKGVDSEAASPAV